MQPLRNSAPAYHTMSRCYSVANYEMLLTDALAKKQYQISSPHSKRRKANPRKMKPRGSNLSKAKSRNGPRKLSKHYTSGRPQASMLRLGKCSWDDPGRFRRHSRGSIKLQPNLCVIRILRKVCTPC